MNGNDFAEIEGQKTFLLFWKNEIYQISSSTSCHFTNTKPSLKWAGSENLIEVLDETLQVFSPKTDINFDDEQNIWDLKKKTKFYIFFIHDSRIMCFVFNSCEMLIFAKIFVGMEKLELW